jgi:hypothetical protein
MFLGLRPPDDPNLRNGWSAMISCTELYFTSCFCTYTFAFRWLPRLGASAVPLLCQHDFFACLRLLPTEETGRKWTRADEGTAAALQQGSKIVPAMQQQPFRTSSLQHQAELHDSSNTSTPGPSNAGGDEGDARWPPKRSAGGKKGTKRPRPTLSCTECVRRKSKCDRVIPCST